MSVLSLRTLHHFVFSGGLVTKHMSKTLAYIPKYNYFKLVSFNESLIIIIVIIIMIRDLLEVNYFYTYFRQSQNINS